MQKLSEVIIWWKNINVAPYYIISTLPDNEMINDYLQEVTVLVEKAIWWLLPIGGVCIMLRSHSFAACQAFVSRDLLDLTWYRNHTCLKQDELLYMYICC